MLALLEYALFALAGGIALRSVAHDIPRLAYMIYKGMTVENAEALRENARQLAAPPTFDHDAYELRLFMDCPSAFWLDPTAFTRPTWPAAPVLSDLRYDNTPADMALAYVLCDPEERVALEQLSAKIRISSVKRWDRPQGGGLHMRNKGWPTAGYQDLQMMKGIMK